MLYNTYSQRGFDRQSRSRKKERSGSFMTLMVAGCSGTGKTTFVQTLCRHFRQPSNPIVDAAQPTEEVYSISLTAKDDAGWPIALTVVDTPGFTDDLAANLRVRDISKFIDHQFQRTLAEETKVKRDAKALDTHIHALLYFVDPILGGQLTDLDRLALTALSSRANVIPVIGKADMLSVTEMQQVKETVTDEIYNHYNIPVYGNVVLEDDYEEDAGSTVDALRNMFQDLAVLDDDDEARALHDYLDYVPFSLIGCETSDDDEMAKDSQGFDDGFVGRRYPWAAIDCFNSKHCDLAPLVSMLLTTHRDMLRISTFERFYEHFRTRQLLQRRISRLITLESNGHILV